MAVSLNSFAPNTQARSSEINQNFSNLKSGVEEASYRSFVWGIQGLLSVANTQGMQYIVPQDITLIKVWAKTSSGTCTVAIKADSTEVTDNTNHLSVSSTVGSSTTFHELEVTAGQVLTLDVLTISSATDLFITLETQVTSIV